MQILTSFEVKLSRKDLSKIISYSERDYKIKKLRIKAKNNYDINVLSTLCQDSIFSFDEMKFFKLKNFFVSTFSRFCWEVYNKEKFYYRVVSGLQVKDVEKIEYINFKQNKNDDFLNLLSITFENGYLFFNFSSFITIKMKVKKIDILLDDLDIPWPTSNKPNHKKK